MKRVIVGVMVFLCLAVSSYLASAAVTPQISQEKYQTLAKPGTKVPLPDGGYFIYGFEKPPKVATCIMRVQVFSHDGKKDTSYIVKGDVDMPSMRGVHSRGDKDFALSNKGVYLLPAPLVMLGDWEFRFTFVKNNKAVFRGAYLFDL